jgi:elongator complex protein 3
MADIKPVIPRYCRVNRMIRDFPSNHIIAGNKRTNLRQDVQLELERRGQGCNCIRCREVREAPVDPEELELHDMTYDAGGAEEHFISFVTPDDKLAGYLRLSFPGPTSPETRLPDLAGAALVREIHIYGQSLEVGSFEEGAAQHVGLGARLLDHAEDLAREQDFKRMAVIAALGTRGYYRKLGYELDATFMVKSLVCHR